MFESKRTERLNDTPQSGPTECHLRSIYGPSNFVCVYLRTYFIHFNIYFFLIPRKKAGNRMELIKFKKIIINLLKTGIFKSMHAKSIHIQKIYRSI